MSKLQSFDTLFQMMAAFPDEQSAIDHFTAIRWKDGAFCPLCGSTRVYHFSDQRTHKCGDCRKRFSIKVGTVFEDSKIELRKWMMAIWLITSHKKGIASTALAKDIGVTQKTAWFMLHRLRHAARTQSFNRPLDGEVEIDETYVGGKASNRHKGDPKNGPGTAGKVAVIGAIERGGNAVAMVSTAPTPTPWTGSLTRWWRRPPPSPRTSIQVIAT
jgi:transposase-like protein